ncbi:hypothetical protein ACLOJK_008283 [Asimina triloba]
MEHPDVISVFPDKLNELHITRSWAFLGLESYGQVPAGSIWNRANFGKDTIIATIDSEFDIAESNHFIYVGQIISGVWPESECFKDDGMGPVPMRWKGSCQNNTKQGVPCNRKLIGAKYFKDGYAASNPIDPKFTSARDFQGHGTHTLSTLGCRFVPGANAFKHANGTAKGGSPAARVAVYKGCWDEGCADSDILAAFDEAIQDGVDVLSLSLGTDEPVDYLQDGSSIGAFHAVMNGITVVCSAGNKGPTPAYVTNGAPWIITVAASTLDRDFPSYVRLGNNLQLRGRSLSPDSLPNKMYPLIYAKDAAVPNADPSAASMCSGVDLDPSMVRGKIVVCDVGYSSDMAKSQVVKNAGGVGLIIANDEDSGNSTTPEPHFLPATQIPYYDSLKLFSYINSTKSPMAYITFPQTVYNHKPNPQIADFSSRGPNSITPSILKPDITAPGVRILAAFSEYPSPSEIVDDPRRQPFAFLDGTSMACPHVSGAVGLLRSLHPHWSPAAIRSAIMTTARTRDNSAQPILDSYTHDIANHLDYGAGHLRPNRAMAPGLVYDITVDDYLNFMCASGYNSTQLDVLRKHQCPPKATSPLDLNYPSITVPELAHDPVTVTRRLKNVGPPRTYRVRVETPLGVSVAVKPQTLTFNRIGEEKSFEVTLMLNNGVLDQYTFGRLIWSDGVHNVRSPISVSSVAIP